MNGWQRLWAFISMVWLAAVCAFGWFLYPPAVDDKEIFHAVSDEALELIAGSGGTVVEKDEDGLRYPVVSTLTEKQNNEVKLAYIQAKQLAFTCKRNEFFWRIALLWVVPCISIYAFGLGVAWVKRGFHINRGGA